MSDYTPVSESGKYAPFCSANVAGGQLVEVTGNNTIGPAGLTSLKVMGVAAQDQVTNGQVFVWPRKGLHESVAGTGGLTAGQPVKSDGSGNVVLWVSGTDDIRALLGYCLVGATATNLARWFGI